MIIYFTSAPKSSLRNYFLNFRSYSVIDTKTIRNEEEKDISGDDRIVNMMIEMRIRYELKKAKHKRRNMNLIYISDNIDSEIVNNLREYYNDCEISTIYVDCESFPSQYDESIFDSIIYIA